jgi:hypothetical protein
MTMTKDIARAIGLDAGNASMRRAGRSQWNEDDFNAASAAYQRAMRLIRIMAKERAP